MDFCVDKDDLKNSLTVQGSPLVVEEGDILIHIVHFAFTANNVSYAATGQALGYWNFFPHPNESSSNDTKTGTWGRIPVWGVGIIVASRCSHFNINQRVYGYFPMSHYVVLRPVSITTADFIDGMPHRSTLPAVYNQYLLCDEDPFHTPRTESAMMVLRPLFFTSWLLLDFFLHRQQRDSQQGRPFVGATNLILSSASSKTSIGLAFLVYQYNQKNRLQIHTVGLTSHRNLQMVKSLGIYDQIICYHQLEAELDPTQPSCFVDMAGNTKLTIRLHQHLSQNLRYSCLVGVTHVGQGGKPTTQLPGAKPCFFFAPSWTDRRIQELGRGSSSAGRQQQQQAQKRRGLQSLLHSILLDYQRFVSWCLRSCSKDLIDHPVAMPWLHMRYYHGPEQVAAGYAECLRGNIPPNTAVIMSLWPKDANSNSASDTTNASSRL